MELQSLSRNEKYKKRSFIPWNVEIYCKPHLLNGAIKYFEFAQPIGLKGKVVKRYFLLFPLILSTLLILDLIILEFVDIVDPKH